jgi:hypothetical protein
LKYPWVLGADDAPDRFDGVDVPVDERYAADPGHATEAPVIESNRPLDRALTAVRHPLRRRVLLALVERGGASTGVDPRAVAPSGTDPERLDVSLTHVHLPKLSALGYARWSNEPVRVRRGQAFTEVEPLVRLLYDHRTELPYEW